jgi:transcriptional regulator with PAS, ATPase and Fis domain
MSALIQSARLASMAHTKLHAVSAPAIVPSRGRYGMAGDSPLMERLYTQIERIGPHFRTALILGETGTGKEMVARALHSLSPAANGPFVVCNASAIVETLFESEVFGHVKGAFTGANADSTGLFEAAHNGTLFLDEIGEMPLGTQAKLLRALENNEIQRVGSPTMRKVEVRILAASNRDLRALAAAGLFRQDLYYRIAMVEIMLPTLHERLEDLPVLVEYLVRRLAAHYDKNIPEVSPEVLEALREHSWPGNIRELENVLGTAIIQSQGNMLVPLDLANMPMTTVAIKMNMETHKLDDIVEQHVMKMMKYCVGNKLRTAEMLGISRSTLYRMLGSYIEKFK